MVTKLRVDVPAVIRELDVALRVLTESRIVSRYRRIFKGKGLEFEEFREYTTRDDANRIDWKASKRSNKLLLREFKEERDIAVFFIVDVSSSMLFGSTQKLKYEYVAELVGALCHFVIESGDKAGLVLFSDRMVKYVEPGKGIKHFYVILKNLLKPEFYGGGYNIGKTLEYVMKTVSERSVAFIVSDFIGLERNWEKSVRLVSGKMDGIAVMVRDPRDNRLPPESGQVVISDPYSKRMLLIDCGDKARHDFETRASMQEKLIRDAFKASMWDFFDVSTSENFVIPVLWFLKRREILFK